MLAKQAGFTTWLVIAEGSWELGPMALFRKPIKSLYPFILLDSIDYSRAYPLKHGVKRNRLDDCQYVHDEVLYISLSPAPIPGRSAMLHCFR